MRKLLFLLLLLPVTAFCVEKHMATGKWKEVKRTLSDTAGKAPDKVVDYKDTIHLQFVIDSGKSKYVWQKQGGFIYKNTYTLTDKNLDLGMRYFTIVQRSPVKLVLKDETGTYEFAPDNSSAQNTAAAPPPVEKPKPVTSIDQMIGHWSVYKSNSDKPLSQADAAKKLKAMDITGGSSDGKLGYLYAATDGDTSPSWTIDSYSNQTLTCSGKGPRTFQVIKCENNDLILKEGAMTYYFKEFKQ
jgi:hypothetical protein